MGVAALPPPTVSAHIVQATGRGPAEDLFGQGGVGDAAGTVARAPIGSFPGHRPACHLLKDPHQFEHRMALATPQIQGEELGGSVEQSVHSRPVAFGQIHDMDVIPDSCAIGRGPVPAINF